jgi:hypothetical protein
LERAVLTPALQDPEALRPSHACLQTISNFKKNRQSTNNALHVPVHAVVSTLPTTLDVNNGLATDFKATKMREWCSPLLFLLRRVFSLFDLLFHLNTFQMKSRCGEIKQLFYVQSNLIKDQLKSVLAAAFKFKFY